MITKADVLARLSYTAADGCFVWRNGPHAGLVAGAIQHNGYRAIMLARKLLLAHRVIWLIETESWPSGPVDHINGAKDDNRFENLRLADKRQNAINSKLRVDSEAGLKGVSRADCITPKWMARIKVGEKRLYLGSFASPEAAHAAYVDAARKHFGEFAREG